MKTGSIDLPLHPGQCPPWLFQRMRRLSKELVEIIAQQYSTKELIARLSDPLWFQALGCTLGFDWHSSGLTTTTCAALREGMELADIGIAMAGGKGKTSLKTPVQLEEKGATFGLNGSDIERMVKASRLSAKVDSSCIQDGHELYHHAFFFDEKGEWSVVQQGLMGQYARRYHWAKTGNFTDNPPNSIIGKENSNVLNLVSKESTETRNCSIDMINDNPVHLKKYFGPQRTLNDHHLVMPAHHELSEMDLNKEDWELLQKAYELQPKSYEELVLLKGMGKKKLRALALVSKLVFGTKLDWKDPVKYSWAHGGKDGFPFPVDKPTYESSIEFIKEAVKQANLGSEERARCLRNLNSI